MSDVRAWLNGEPSRGELKRYGTLVDSDGDLRAAVMAEGRRRGVEMPADVDDWQGKRLLRWVLHRSDDAQVLRNPIRRNDAFCCVHCGAEVPAAAGTARNHCPRCLRSLHVDVIPGDRMDTCRGLLDPVAVVLRGGDEVLVHRCRRCGEERVVRVLDDDDRAALEAVARART